MTELVHAPSFDELFRKIDLKKAGWPADTTPAQAASDMAAYYDKEEESRLGTVAIRIKQPGHGSL